MAGMLVFPDSRKKDFPIEQARLAVAELKRLRPYFLGNLHLLAPLTVGYHDWCAYQYHRPDLRAAVAVFLRRHESPFPMMEVGLREIESSVQYEVTLRTGFENPKPKQMPGLELMRLRINIAKRPGSALLEYSATR